MKTEKTEKTGVIKGDLNGRAPEGASGDVLIGRVGSPMGLRGEFRITLHAQDSDNLKEGKVLLLKHAEKNGNAGSGAELRAAVKTVRYQKERPVVRLEGFEDRTAAEALRGMEVYIEAGDLEPLPEGEHYVRNLIGCRVVDIAGEAGSGAGEGAESRAGGRELGVLRDVIQNTAQSILEVVTPEGKTILIPAVDAFLRNIDEETRLIEVELIPGFTD